MTTFKSIINKQEDDILKKFKVKSKAKSKYDKWHYVHTINILSNILHMSDDDIMRYFHNSIMLKGPVTHNCEIRKKLFDNYNLVAQYSECHELIDDDFEENYYYLYENGKHLILHESCYITGDGTDHWITLIR